ncbi:bifunctional DNA-formamidopyrimidine glycosylase/DNA-(apurinic or apyrimidinic site) lyase [Botrimarina hoheduenensis]|uniref:Formamidopyrimidine-DNA glycosylase n=1 Tax=Botrimarina hoheduenensis TaxID=2528000 RepID=A0A5C5VZ74_9BACT|nr:bifunctional DNA-formamidopyrimidine glycosylase/DNA-(apurinic or apyrimidinic site) lyase [Botrimarina hoheduenensis]TWT43387.1 Formamidopyrimidine-DNA glycosylase [Botrimarina hoheduenensis]
MPELPEVETMRRNVAGATGATIVAVEKLACPRKPIGVTPRLDRLRRRVVERTVAAVERAGKRVVLRLDSGERLILEPRMTGLVGAGESPNPLYLRLGFTLEGGGLDYCWYWDQRGLGKVHLYDEAEFARALGPAKLGPDGLFVTDQQLRERLASSRRPIKVALLDQQAVAGIGNIYAAEILHVAGVHPATRCDRLTRQRWRCIADATHEVLEEAIRYEGSSLGDGTYRNKLNQDGGYQHHHRVYGRAGEPCPRCRGAVERIVQAQRSTFFCSQCQTRR